MLSVIGKHASAEHEKGFTLLEALIGMALLTLTLMGTVAMMTYFGTQTSDQVLKRCLLDSASTALSQYRANSLPVSTTTTCRNITVNVSLDYTTFPLLNFCNDVTATASANGKSTKLKTKVCNFQ